MATTPPLAGVHTAKTVGDLDTAYFTKPDDYKSTDDLEEANVSLSLVKTLSSARRHKVLLDIDHPAQLIPSSTEGHFHLYIDVEIDEEPYFAMLDALAKARVIQDGFALASRDRGFTALRLPWIKKRKP